MASVFVDNGDAGYAETGSGWTDESAGAAYGGHDHYAGPTGSGANTAAWAFTGLTAATNYLLALAYIAGGNRGTNVPITVYDSDGTTVLFSGTLNQQSPCDDFTDASVGWRWLGKFTPSGTSLKIKITDNANGYVIADAARLQLAADTILSTGTISCRDGDWATATTWVPASKPVSGTATTIVRNHVTVTSSEVTGNDPGSNGTVVTVTAVGKLTVGAGGTLRTKGAILAANSTVELSATATLSIDGGYSLQLGSATTDFSSLLKCSGIGWTIQTTPATTGTAYIAGAANCQHFDIQGSGTFKNLRDGDNLGINIQFLQDTHTTDIFRGISQASYILFDNCLVNYANGIGTNSGAEFTWCRWTNTAAAPIVLRTAGAPAGGVTRSVTHCSFDLAPLFIPGGGFKFSECFFDSEYQLGGTDNWPSGNFERLVIRVTETSGGGISGISLYGDVTDVYVLADAGTDNPHIVIPKDTGSTQSMTRVICEYTQGTATDSGNWVYSAGTTTGWTVDQAITMPAVNTDSPGAITASNPALQVKRCTLYSPTYSGGILIGDGSAIAATYTAVQDNLFWVDNDGTVGHAATAVGAGVTTDNVLTPANCHHNLCINLHATRYEGSYPTTQPGANDVVVTGVDITDILYSPRRNSATFAVMMGSASSTYADKVIDARAYLEADPGLAIVLRTHVRGGNAIINATYKGRASDGLDHGACRMPTPLEPASASGTTVTLADWSHPLDDGVTPDPDDFAFASERTCTGVTVGASSVTLTGVDPPYHGSVVGDYITYTPGGSPITADDTSEAIAFGLLITDDTPADGAPAAPAPFTDDNVEPAEGGTSIAWLANDPGDAVTAYTLERKIGVGGYSVIYTGLTTNFLDTGTTAGDTVSYRLKATNGSGDSDYSSVVTVTSQGGGAPRDISLLFIRIFQQSVTGQHPVFN